MKEIQKQVDMFYAAICFLAFFTAQGCIAYRMIYPWRDIGVHASLILTICFATMPFIIYPRFRDLVKKRSQAKIEEAKKPNRYLSLLIVLSAALSIAIPILPYVLRSLAIIANVVIIPCGLFWSTDAYEQYKAMRKEEEKL